MSEHFADSLFAAIDAKGAPVCVGIDPVYQRLPESVRRQVSDPLDAIAAYCREVLRIVAPIVPAVKPQSAYFEVYRGKGVELYFELVRQATELGLVVIGDVKRNDIGSTAQAYAAGHLAGAGAPQSITVNGYLGIDGLQPFLDVAREEGKGLFVLVRTSNPSAPQLQDFTDADGKRLYQHLAEQLHEIGRAEGLIGQCGYSCVGAVVGATYPDEARALRKLMPHQIFLVPGYGAQGASAADCAASFDADGRGAIVNASRSVLYAHARPEYQDTDWKTAVASAARAFAKDIATAVKR